MKRCASACLLILLCFGFSRTAIAARQTSIEILYMNHGPLLDTIARLKSLLSKFGDKVNVSWYDFESSEGERFMAKKGITRHVPLIVWIDGRSSAKVARKEIEFIGFPAGSGPASFRGNWSMDNLSDAISQTTARK